MSGQRITIPRVEQVNLIFEALLDLRRSYEDTVTSYPDDPDAKSWADKITLIDETLECLK